MDSAIFSPPAVKGARGVAADIYCEKIRWDESHPFLAEIGILPLTLFMDCIKTKKHSIRLNHYCLHLLLNQEILETAEP